MVRHADRHSRAARLQHKAYITGDDPDVAIMVIHDLFGWDFPNTRLLADHLAREAGATVYVPDFFGGARLPWAPVAAGRSEALGDSLARFVRDNGRDVARARGAGVREGAARGGPLRAGRRRRLLLRRLGVASASRRQSTARHWSIAYPSATSRS